jgi:hypothetical protein
MNRIDRIFEDSLSCQSFFISSSTLNKYQGNSDDVSPDYGPQAEEDSLAP